MPVTWPPGSARPCARRALTVLLRARDVLRATSPGQAEPGLPKLHRRCAPALQVRRRVRRFYQDEWFAQQDGLDVAAFYGELPHSLRTGQTGGRGGGRPNARQAGG